MVQEQAAVKSREQAFCASDGIYAAQALRFTKLLQKYDKNLIAKWLPDKFRWSIWTRDRKGCAYLVYLCVDPVTKGFRQIGQQDVKFIGAMDQYRRTKAQSVLDEVEAHNAQLTEQKKKAFRNGLGDFARDRWRQFAGNPVVRVGIDLKG